MRIHLRFIKSGCHGPFLKILVQLEKNMLLVIARSLYQIPLLIIEHVDPALLVVTSQDATNGSLAMKEQLSMM